MSMKIGEKPFFDRVDDALDDDFMRHAMSSAQDRLRDKKLDATERDEQIGDWEEWRNAGEEIRSHTLENLDFYLDQLSEKFAERGVMFISLKQQKMQIVIFRRLLKKRMRNI